MGGSMKLVIDFVEGCEGDSLSIGNEDDKGYGTGRRIAGPKPWGGGKILRSFKIDPCEIMYILKEINCVYPEELKKACTNIFNGHKEDDQ
jgi:hypothetical protein